MSGKALLPPAPASCPACGAPVVFDLISGEALDMTTLPPKEIYSKVACCAVDFRHYNAREYQADLSAVPARH